jgi:hypothetical protein
LVVNHTADNINFQAANFEIFINYDTSVLSFERGDGRAGPAANNSGKSVFVSETAPGSGVIRITVLGQTVGPIEAGELVYLDFTLTALQGEVSFDENRTGSTNALLLVGGQQTQNRAEDELTFGAGREAAPYFLP